MRSSSLLALVPLVLALSTPDDAHAQAAWGDAAKKAAPPAPATPGAMTGSNAGSGGGSAAPSKPVNNEGTSKVSGSSGSGAVTNGSKPKAKAAPKAKSAVAQAKVKPASTKLVAQWPGFRLTEDGGSEVMIEFSNPPTVPTEHRAKGSVTYVFKGAALAKANNQNPLITVHFNTPVAAARLVPKKGELHLVVEMRPGADAAPTSALRASSDGDGQQFFVHFPAGVWLPKGADEELIAPAPTQKVKAKGSDDGAGTAKPAPATTPPSSGSKTGPNP